MNQEKKRLAEAKKQWENDIRIYNNFLKGKSQTFEGRYGANEYISMAKNRIKDINDKLKEIEKES